jgi:hypothetical protein
MSGKVYEAVLAKLEHRRPCDLYHAALVVHAPEGDYVIEQTPVSDAHGAERRGVVAGGAVGAHWAGHFRVFQYEIRRWLGGTIPDVHAAIDSPIVLSEEAAVVRRVLAVAPLVPTPVWGRDELRTGEMWNSNSVIAWILASAGLDVSGVRPPARGRAPGWNAGLTIAHKDVQANAAP